MIEILIPTFNRSEFLIKNLNLIDAQIKVDGLSAEYRILVSNNCSTDDTCAVLAEVAGSLSCELVVFDQVENIGLERNAIFLLEKAQADFIVYLGDDDYLPQGYLKFVAEATRGETELAAIIPGFSGLYHDGTVLPARHAAFGLKKFRPGVSAAVSLSNFGHQLSGLVLKRKGLLEGYLTDEGLRNIYPFVYFVAACNATGISIYAPKFQVLVTQGNSKDWRYDDSGLLLDIFRNFRILYPASQFRRFLLSWSFASKQSWRLRVGLNPFPALKAALHLLKSPEVDPLFKVSLLFLYPYCYVKKAFRLCNKLFSSARPVDPVHESH